MEDPHSASMFSASKSTSGGFTRSLRLELDSTIVGLPFITTVRAAT